MAEEAVDAVANDLGERPGRPRKDRRSGGQRLDRRQAERFWPLPGHERGVALGEETVPILSTQLAQQLHLGRPGGRHEHVVVVGALLLHPAHLGGDAQPPSRQPGDLDRVQDSLFRSDPADEAEVFPALGLERSIGEVQPVVHDARPGQVGMGGRLGPADGDESAGRGAEGVSRERLVQPAVEGHHDRDGCRPRQEQADPLEVRMDHVELVRPTQDVRHGRHEIARPGVRNLARGPKGLGHGGHEAAGGGGGVARREQGHVVAPRDELADERVHHALRSTVAGRRDGLLRWCDLGDP